MQDHWIRLRGGWEWLADHLADPTAPNLRLTLPTAWPPEARGRVRLARSFQTPAFDRRTESLFLRLDDVQGLVLATLNGRRVVGSPRVDPPLLIALGDDLPSRNRLILEVDMTGPRDLGPDRLWGSIALVIRGSGPIPQD